MNKAWRQVSRNEPCLICLKPDWCATSADGVWALCRRVDAGDGIHRIDKGGSDYWLYPRDGAKLERPAIQVPTSVTPQRASLDAMHRVCQTLLDSLSLARAHRDSLHRRGLSDDEIDQRGYRSLPISGRAAIARRLVERYGAEACSGIPGLYVRSQDGRRWWSLAGPAGLLIPVRDDQGRIMALMVRRDGANADPRYLFISSARYGGPGPMVIAHVPLHDRGPGSTCRLTEGALKADAAASLDDAMTIGLSAGVTSWRQSIPVLQAMKVDVVHLAFDSDARSNAHVAQALRQAVRGLRAAGLVLKLEIWSDEHKGIDDLLVAGGTPEVLEGKAVWQVIRANFRSTARGAPNTPRADDHAMHSIHMGDSWPTLRRSWMASSSIQHASTSSISAIA